VGDAHKILIVDDDPIGRQVLFEALGQYHLETAENGREALSIVSSFEPDLLLLDVNLPEVSGYEVCRTIRGNRASHLTKIVLVSANITLEERLRGYEVGADDYITKPFNTKELQAKVDVFVKLKREEEVAEARSNLFGLFSHETRTPLGVIIGFSDLLRTNVSKSVETRQCAEVIYKSALDLHYFLEKTTLLGRLKTGYKPERSTDFLRLHISKAIHRNQPRIDDKLIRVATCIPADLTLTVDWETFDEVLGYIVENAVKFSEPGGTVSITATRVDAECRIDVADRGAGIPPAWINNIFGEFAVRDIMHHKRGQGLSLSIAKQVVELHGGRIEVDSELDKGSVFSISLPSDSAAEG
jgi:two-component system, sensor histidine kinase and response regulator